MIVLLCNCFANCSVLDNSVVIEEEGLRYITNYNYDKTGDKRF